MDCWSNLSLEFRTKKFLKKQRKKNSMSLNVWRCLQNAPIFCLTSCFFLSVSIFIFRYVSLSVLSSFLSVSLCRSLPYDVSPSLVYISPSLVYISPFVFKSSISLSINIIISVLIYHSLSLSSLRISLCIISLSSFISFFTLSQCLALSHYVPGSLKLIQYLYLIF